MGSSQATAWPWASNACDVVLQKQSGSGDNGTQLVARGSEAQLAACRHDLFQAPLEVRKSALYSFIDTGANSYGLIDDWKLYDAFIAIIHDDVPRDFPFIKAFYKKLAASPVQIRLAGEGEATRYAITDKLIADLIGEIDRDYRAQQNVLEWQDALYTTRIDSSPFVVRSAWAPLVLQRALPHLMESVHRGDRDDIYEWQAIVIGYLLFVGDPTSILEQTFASADADQRKALGVMLRKFIGTYYVDPKWSQYQHFDTTFLTPYQPRAAALKAIYSEFVQKDPHVDGPPEGYLENVLYVWRYSTLLERPR